MTATLKTTIIQEPSSATANLTLDTSGGVTVGQNLTVTGTTSGVGGLLIREPQILTTGTSYTTPAGCTKIYVEVVGGGGGGGTGFGSGTNSGAGGGGGAGGYAAKYFTPVTPLTAYTYAIGAGGTSAGAGGNTTFTVSGTTITGGGGSAGQNGSNGGARGGNGGTATNGDLNVKGSGGSPGAYQNTTNSYSGAGGGSLFGGGGNSVAVSTVGGAGEDGGGGGGGASYSTAGGGSTQSGGAGGAGVIRIWEYT